MDGSSDDYVLTPLAEVEDAESPTGEEDDGSAVAAEDYVQSLVTIESNWANGKWLARLLSRHKEGTAFSLKRFPLFFIHVQ